jgi:hypothetical protein
MCQNHQNLNIFSLLKLYGKNGFSLKWFFGVGEGGGGREGSYETASTSSPLCPFPPSSSHPGNTKIKIKIKIKIKSFRNL